jgi:N-hydroxyarylamine O-acetyltransferase
MAQLYPPIEDLERMELSNEEMHSYCERIGYHWDADDSPSKKMLYEVHRLHMLAIPFENLSVFLEDGVNLSLQAIARKFSDTKLARGGYCFEQNRMLAAVLLKLGFEVETKEGRVWLDDGEKFRKPYLPVRNHIVVLCRAGKQLYLCDVGFGRLLPCEPIPLQSDTEIENGWCTTQLIVDQQDTQLTSQEMWYMWYLDPIVDAWKRGYSFDVNAEFSWVDAEPANMFVHSHPDSVFTQVLYIESAKADCHTLLFGNELRQERFAKDDDSFLTRTVTSVVSGSHLRALCQEHFSIALGATMADDLFAINAAAKPDKWKLFTALRAKQRARTQSLAAQVQGGLSDLFRKLF